MMLEGHLVTRSLLGAVVAHVISNDKVVRARLTEGIDGDFVFVKGGEAPPPLPPPLPGSGRGAGWQWRVNMAAPFI